MGSQSAPIGTRLEGKFTSQLSIFSRFILGSSFGAETHAGTRQGNPAFFVATRLTALIAHGVFQHPIGTPTRK